jgi:branched-chain amino acid aminotransferase
MISIRQTKHSRLPEADLKTPPFGRTFTDHMLVADFEDGEWKQAEIVPFGNLSLSPATFTLHYAQAIFEGMKAYHHVDGNPYMFRPEKNWARMNISAARMGMPEIPKEIFMEGITELVRLDHEWVPSAPGTSLYIRPNYFATDEFIGLNATHKFKLVVILSPSNVAYTKPMRVFVADQYVRAFKGGVGFAKAAGNYGATMMPMIEARKLGCDQVLWTDGKEFKYVEEIGTMNVFFHIGDALITPELDGTILAGITRESLIQLARHLGMKVEERRISIDEIIEAANKGTLHESFGAGTAASVIHIVEYSYKNKIIKSNQATPDSVSAILKNELDGIRRGTKPDIFGWMKKVEVQLIETA